MCSMVSFTCEELWVVTAFYGHLGLQIALQKSYWNLVFHENADKIRHITQSFPEKFTFISVRIRCGKIPDQRQPKQGRVCALEKAMREFVQRKSGQVVAPEIGREFDSLAEAFEFYNLYSWEIGFGIRYGQSRTNAKKSRTVQDIVCGCAVSIDSIKWFFGWHAS